MHALYVGMWYLQQRGLPGLIMALLASISRQLGRRYYNGCKFPGYADTAGI